MFFDNPDNHACTYYIEHVSPYNISSKSDSLHGILSLFVVTEFTFKKQQHKNKYITNV